MLDVPLANRKVYLSRMAAPLQEKLKVRRYIPRCAKRVLDVGCADGTVTLALAELMPQTHFVGIDLDARFIQQARARAKKRGIRNVEFRKVHLWKLFDEPARFDSVLFVSMLHEVYSYNGGMPAVIRAITAAHHLLVEDGDIIIRDMVLSDHDKLTPAKKSVLRKVRSRTDLAGQLADFEHCFGTMKTRAQLNHFVLKYLYPENWKRECREDYVPVTMERYLKIFEVLDMEVVRAYNYLLPYLHNLWKKDFGLTDAELTKLKSTAFLVARK